MEIVSDSQMREGDSATPVRSLEVSISFGRFEKDLLSWEKWSAFSQNKYLEEVEKCSTPGSVKAKKAFFEARNKLIVVRKAEALNKQMEARQESKEENGLQTLCGNEVNQYNEEVTEENLFQSGLSSPSLNQHNELETNVFSSKEPVDEDDIIDASDNQFVNDTPIIVSETSCPFVDLEKKDSTLFMSESETLNKDNATENTSESNSEYDIFDGQFSARRVLEERISKIELGGCETDQPFNMQSFVLGSSQVDEEKQVRNPTGIGSKLDAYNDALEDSKEESVLNMLDQLKVDDFDPSYCPPSVENEHFQSKVAEDFPAFITEKLNVETACDGGLPNISATKKTQTQKEKPRPQNSRKVFPANKQNSTEHVKKIPVSHVPGSPQISAPKISKPSIAAVKSASQSMHVSRVKKTATPTPSVRNLPQVPNVIRSTSHSTVPSLKPSSPSSSKKGTDLLTSRKKIISPGVTQKPTPKSLHTSLSLGSKVSNSISGVPPATEPRKSMFLEKMGDKDIVKRAFRAFQNMSTSTSLNIDNSSTSKVVRDKTDVLSSQSPPKKEKGRLVKKCEVDVKNKMSTSIYKSDKLTHSKEDKRNEVRKFAEKTEHLSKSKYKECRVKVTGDLNPSLTNKAATWSGLHTR